jgi:hypothetical protein
VGAACTGCIGAAENLSSRGILPRTNMATSMRTFSLVKKLNIVIVFFS